MLAVRDGLPSAFVHGFLDPRLIRDTVRGIKELGYEFVSLRDFDCRVASDDRLIATGKAAREIKLRDSYLHQFLVGPDAKHRQETWAEKRFTGREQVSLQPDADEILVAIGEDERPVAPPSVATRLKRTLTSMLSRFRTREPEMEQPRPVKTAILWRANARGAEGLDQESLAGVFRAYGAAPHVIPVPSLATATLGKDEILLVPHAAATIMSGEDVSRVSQWVREGGQLILDGRSTLSEVVGVRYPGGTILAERVTDSAQVDLELKWRPAAVVERFRVPDPGAILTREATSRLGLAASFSHGAGKVLYLAALLDPYSRDGGSRYPFLFEHALRAFDRRQPARARAIELYFDPGLRTDVSIEDLAVQWRRMGVRVIYAAAWVFDRRYTYDYDRLIRVCHANGILVYAWFEFPQVTPAFWKDYPEWREVAAAGKTLPSWRLAMNLANPACRQGAVHFMTSTLGRWAWDGVNLAELSFDGKADGDAAAGHGAAERGRATRLPRRARLRSDRALRPVVAALLEAGPEGLAAVPGLPPGSRDGAPPRLPDRAAPLRRQRPRGHRHRARQPGAPGGQGGQRSRLGGDRGAAPGDTLHAAGRRPGPGLGRPAGALRHARAALQGDPAGGRALHARHQRRAEPQRRGDAPSLCAGNRHGARGLGPRRTHRLGARGPLRRRHDPHRATSSCSPTPPPTGRGWNVAASPGRWTHPSRWSCRSPPRSAPSLSTAAIGRTGGRDTSCCRRDGTP